MRPNEDHSQERALLVRQLDLIAALGAADRSVLNALPMRVRNIARDQDIVREGDRPSDCCLVLSGLVCRYKIVSGGRRQIVSFHFPGDLPDLQSLNLPVMDHSLLTLSPVRAAFIPHEAVRAAMDGEKGVRDALITHGLVDGSIFREWIASIGRRNALERIAHLFCECFVRLRVRGLAYGQSFELLLTQAELGDATGLSNVHVNRVLQELRGSGLLKTTGRKHEILDWPGLQAAGDFSPAYLHLRTPPPGATA
jgi:CRP-like cAMP-binding protein